MWNRRNACKILTTFTENVKLNFKNTIQKMGRVKKLPISITIHN
jgi:hypothetical protein